MITNFLYKNIRWQFNQNPFANLLGKSTCEQQFYEQLEKIANTYYPETRRIDMVNVEFCLNKITLARAKNSSEKVALGYCRIYWAQYVRLKTLFNKKYMSFPANGTATRVEAVAELLAKCTQFAVEDKTLDRMCARATEIVQMSEREERYLSDVVALYKTKYYCAATIAILDKYAYGERYLAKFLRPILLKSNYAENIKYTQTAYCIKDLATVVNCMGESVAKLNDVYTNVDTRLFVYANGRNVFDTFCKSRFGERTAEFSSTTKTVDVTMRYFIAEQKEIRNVTVTNKGSRARKFTVEIPLKYADPTRTATYFHMDNALCIAADLYSALAIVHDNATMDCYGEQARCFEVKIDSNCSFSFDVVTIYAHDTPTLADKIAELNRAGSTRSPYLWDSACTRQNTSDITLKLSPHGYVLRKPHKIMSQQLNYTYQLGNNDVATFVDNGGNSTTLVDGFAFGVKGESVYSVRNGLIIKLNDNHFRLDADTLRYSQGGSGCNLYHNKGKVYEVTHAKPCRTLFYFPLENKATVTYDNTAKVFTVTDNVRKYFVKCCGNVESYTTNALECSEEKLRYKLSCNLVAGNCLAICFGSSVGVNVEIISASETPVSAPIVRESLVSTYLNYVNDKNVFCLRNHLKKPDCLTVAAICYTNPQYVKNYLEKIYTSATSTTYYYDAQGRAKQYYDKLTFPLAVIYYLNLVGELPQEMVKTANGMLFSDNYEGKELCVKALALIKACRVGGFDKVRCLVEYNHLKKRITSDSKLYAYAQAIGALPLSNPSKERLKDLCNKYDIPKSWYYVSQLENLYGLSISAGKLHIAPKVTAENVLEQFALNISGKRIDTTFAKATVQSMTLNGIQCFQPFYPQNLKNTDNQLVVRY
ncbi:MAG: hypothetical protein J1G02_04435 [Clostridiales bacterium]|nr:hypothetical protein [Clostridiales bacterium]